MDNNEVVTEEVAAVVENNTGIEIEPLFEEQVDFDTFSKSDFRVVKVKNCEAVPKSNVITLPQVGQRGTLLPHCPQNFASSFIIFLQNGHIILYYLITLIQNTTVSIPSPLYSLQLQYPFQQSYFHF